MIAMVLALMGVPQEIVQIRVRPSSEADTVLEFESSCVAGFRDYAAVKRAAGASARGYVAEPDRGPQAWRNWNSPFGTLHYREGDEVISHSLPECNLTSFTRASVDRPKLHKAVKAMVRRHAQGRSVEFEQQGHHGWSWRDARAMSQSVILVLDPATPNQITLSLRPMAVKPSKEF